LLTPILIDSFYKKNFNQSNIEIIRSSKDACSAHSCYTSLSFTQYNQCITLITTDFSEDSLIEIFNKLLSLKIENQIFMPFGSNFLSRKLSDLLSKFNPSQLYCSFNNISDKNNYPGVLPYVTAVAANDINRNYYFKYNESDVRFYQLVDPIKVIKKKLVFNSFILGDYYYSLYKKININTKKEIIMPTWNFENGYEFEVKKDELFGFLITEDSSAVAHGLPDGVNFNDGFLYGSVDSLSTFSISINGETQEFLINPSKENNYQFSILAKKW
jgi:hypothetical protein